MRGMVPSDRTARWLASSSFPGVEVLGTISSEGGERTLTLRSRHFRQDCCGRIFAFESEGGMAWLGLGSGEFPGFGNSVMMGLACNR